MLLEQRIQKLCRLSDSEKAIGELLLERRYDLKNLSTRDIASLTYTSSATVVRFAQKLGYKGFNDLKDDYLAELHYLDTHFRRVDANFPFDKQDNTLEVAGKLNALLKETLDDTLSLVDGHMLQRVTQLFKRSHTIHIFGIGSNLLLGRLFQLEMRRIGKKVEIESLVGEFGFNINTIDKEDCVLLISYSGESQTVLNHGRLLKEKGIPMVAITSLGDNSLKALTPLVLHVTTREKQYTKVGNFSSEYSIRYLLDLLYATYFQLDYDKHLQTKIALSKAIEKCRHPQSEIIREEDI
ncbi:HTH-type transcriptional regulator MurR [Clostridiales bacterium CHKCI006]|nr:HTH-type transcriptional regulator MurR [Clostridiales bacterium CHKCI006]